MLNLDNFNDNQKKAILHKNGACCVIASAGSGKTRVLTYRIANLINEGISPENILAVTFTKKASDEMKERLLNLIGIEAEEVNMGTFHSICYGILRSEKPRYNEVDLAHEWWQKKTIKEITSPPSSKYPHGLNMPSIRPSEALGWISYQKNNLKTPNSPNLIVGDSISFLEPKLRKMYKYYEDIKKTVSKIDFDDMLIKCYKLLKNEKSILEKYQNQFKYILIDEFQDTNLAQNEIIKLLGAKHGNVFVVGDWRQSIYGFRASDVNIILNFQREWKNSEVIHLDINYRSTSNIVEWSNRLIRNGDIDLPTSTISNKPIYEDPIIMSATNEDGEAEVITNEIMDLIDSGSFSPKDIAILYRTNAQSRALEEALIKSDIPYVIIGGQNFYKRKEIRDIVAYLKLSQNPHDDYSLQRVVNRPNRFLGKAFIDEMIMYANQENESYFDSLANMKISSEWRFQGALKLHRIIKELYENNYMQPKHMINLIREMTDYDNWLINEELSDGDTGSDRLENITSLQTIASKFDDIPSFLDYVSNMSSATRRKDEDSDKVKLMTIHRSKGLEFPVVYVSGVSNGLLPHNKSETNEEIDEERRLCYVAMTRAEKLLRLSFTEEYQMREAGASMFIEELLVSSSKEEVPVWL